MNRTDIKKLYGVGAVRAAAYAKMGIETVEDLLEHYPRGYENRGEIRLLSECDGTGKHALLLTVATEAKSHRIRGRLSLLKFRAYDESGVCEITFFNQDFLRQVFAVGAVFRFYGKVERTGTRYTMTSPAYEPYSEQEPLPPLLPVYPLTEGLSQKQVAKDVRHALRLYAVTETGEDPLPEEIRTRNGLCLHSYALNQIHNPDSYAALAAAKKRLIFEEFFTFALGLALAGTQAEQASAVPCRQNDLSRLTASLPYRLTDAQVRVIAEIQADMAKDRAMNRLLVGDVGCGKTVCAAAAMWIAVQSGRQAVLMAPTEILARQHYADLCELFAPLQIRPALLVGSVSAAEKKRIRAGLAAEDPAERIQVAVGTQALLSEDVRFACPGVVVTDEQHRFGVNQRACLADKNLQAHLLVMSATPIPRSLALALYGDLAVSTIDEMPPGRQRVDTFVVDESYRTRLDAFIRKQIAEGGQVYVVCPAVEESEDTEEPDVTLADIDREGVCRAKAPLKSVVRVREEMSERFPDASVALLHGKMKSKEKETVMQAFAEGRVQILVSTTVIEVGVNVPNACLMIVENAERFGLSQLHQLRGRVGRGNRRSYCVLVSEEVNGEGTAKERLQIMHSCYDGYSIAERDLELRGPGDFLRTAREGTVRQSGGVHLKLAELCDDSGLLHTAIAEAKALLTRDPTLTASPVLAEQVHRMFSLDARMMN